MHDVIIIGGGLAGLVNAIKLSAAGLDVLVIERKSYPFHRVCGEYISNEVLGFLKSIEANPAELNPAKISKFRLSSPSGKSFEIPLDMGGFGISRYKFDYFLYQKAYTKGAEFLLNTKVNNVSFHEDSFNVEVEGKRTIKSKIVIGSFGKRSNLDKELNRTFFTKRSPYLAVKYHLQADIPEGLISLHNFKDGYCGVSKIEEDKVCLCYLSARENLLKYKSIPEMEANILHKNPFLKDIFTNSISLYEKPEVINEISFASKTPVENHILMSGDSAGMITPLCGNGMAMAIHSAKIASDEILNYFQVHHNRTRLEAEYTKQWQRQFAQRLRIGRTVQKLFGKEFLSEIALNICSYPPLANWIIKNTHGEEF